jgi:hypothetical protein
MVPAAKRQPEPHRVASQVEVRYGQSPALYVNQFVIAAGDEQVLLDCSSGVEQAHDAERAVLPVHTRLALSWGAVERLAGLLQQVLTQRRAGPAGVDPRGRPLPPLATPDLACLPALEDTDA